LAPFLPVGSTPTVPAILGLDQRTFDERVAGKTLMLDDGPAKTPSLLLKGKKLNRGDEGSRTAARVEFEERAGKRKRSGLVGMRKARKRGGMTNRGEYIE